MEPHLVFRENRDFYKKLGLALSVLLPLFYVCLLGFGVTDYVGTYGASHAASYSESYELSENGAHSLRNVLALKMTAIFVPITIFFALAGFLTLKFTLEKFREIENGHIVSFKMLNAGFRRNYIRAQIIYFFIAIICGMIYKIWFLGVIDASAPPLANGAQGGPDYLNMLFRFGLWVAINCIIWFVFVLPISCFGSLILKMTSFRPESD